MIMDVTASSGMHTSKQHHLAVKTFNHNPLLCTYFIVTHSPNHYPYSGIDYIVGK